MYMRKFYGFLITSILSTTILTLLMLTDGEYEFFETFGFISLVATPVILVYGVPVSLLSDYVTKPYHNRKRATLAFIIHLGFGLGFVFIIGMILDFETLLNNFAFFWSNAEFYFIASTTASFLFWLSDEILRKIMRR
ncbi:MAG: hypothetical protein H0Z33_07720 [Bacillaceae bacterium]|nr:hypothetical protein [Bacillaceae bacterium]